MPIVAALALLLALSGTTGASAASGHREYVWFAGSGPVCELDPSACPAIARAPNGDTIELRGEGTFTIHPKSVNGRGEFTHKAPDGTVIGTASFQAEQVLGFNSYGSGAAQGLDPELEGGLLLLRVTVDPDAAGVPDFGGILQIDCELGDHVPPGHHEGVRLNIQGVINFNEKVSGFTVYVRL